MLGASPLSTQIEAAAAFHFASSLTNDQTIQGRIISVVYKSSNATDVSRARLACLISDLVFDDYEDGEQGYIDNSSGSAYTNRTEINWYVNVASRMKNFKRLLLDIRPAIPSSTLLSNQTLRKTKNRS